jgi:hypothetical protein
MKSGPAQHYSDKQYYEPNGSRFPAVLPMQILDQLLVNYAFEIG